MLRIVLSLLLVGLSLFAGAQSPPSLSTRVEGRLVATITGQPVVEARLVARPLGRPAGPARAATSDEEGVFRFEELAPGGEYALSIEATGFAPYSGKFTAGPEPLRLILQREGVLAGRVVAAGHAVPIAAATVEYLGRRAMTDASGEYRLGGLGNSWGAPVAWTDSLVPEKKPTEKVQVRVARRTQAPPLRLVPTCSVEITIRDARSGRLLDADLELAEPLPWSPRVHHASGGRLTLELLPPWDAALVIAATGYRSKAVTLTPSAALDAATTVQLFPLPVVRGRVVDAKGAGVADATVTCSDDARRILGGSKQPHSTGCSTVTSATGFFELEVDRERGLRLTAARPSYATGEARDVSIASGEVVITLRRGGAIEGRVVHADGAPAPGATVVLTPDRRDFASAGSPRELGSPAPATAHEEGRYQFQNLVPGRYGLQATATGEISRLMEGLIVEDGSRRLAPDLVLTPGYAFSGVVVEEGTDRPIEGLLVGLDGQGIPAADSRSDESGAFKVSNLAPGLYRIRLEYEPDHPSPVYLLPGAMNRPVVEIVDQDVTDYRIALRAGACASGRVVDAETGAPVAGALIRPLGRGMGDVMRMIEARPTTSDADGAFLVKNLSPGSALKLSAWHRDYALGESEVFDLLPGQSRTDVEIRLSRGRSISGVVLDGEGRPAPKVWVSGRTGGDFMASALRMEQMEASLSAETDEAGRFTLAKLPPGTYDLLAARERNPLRLMFGGGATTVELSADADTTDVVLKLPIEVPAEGYLKGRVVDGEGRSVPNTRILATGMVQPFNVDLTDLDKRQGDATSGPDGRYEIRNIKPGKYTVMVFEGQRQRRSFPNVDVPQEDYTITLEARGCIAGKVVGSRGEPVASFRLAPLANEPNPWQYNPFESREGQLFSSREGVFEVTDLEAGSYRLKVEADGYAPRTSEPIEVKSGQVTRDVTVHLTGGGAVRLHVTRAGGGAVEGARITRDEGDMRQLVQAFLSGGDPAAGARGPATNAQGFCTVSYLPPGQVAFRVLHPRFAPTRAETTVQEGRTVELPVEMLSGGILEGHVRDRAGNPIAGESITILSNTSGFGMPSEMGMVETDAQGHYFRGHLPAGTYVVMRNLFGMLGGGSGIGSKTAVVEEGMITEVNFDEKGARLWGFVKRGRSTLRNYEEMEPVRGARLMLTGIDNNAVMASAQTDEAGRYEFVGLDAGKYHVTLQGTAMGFSVLRFSEVALGREEEKELNFTWPEGVIRGRVVTRSGGRPIAGAEVYFKLTGAPAAGMPAFPSMVRSDAEGRFEKGELAGGVVLVTARAEGHGQDEVEVRLAEGEVTEDVVLHLGGGGVLAGRIARADGAAEPFPGKMLKLFRPDGSPALPGLNIVPTEADGSYRIDGLPAGDVLVLALGMGLAPQMLPATIRDGETTTLDIAMQPGIVLELSVVDDEGHPVEHAHIAVRNAADFTLPLEESGLINKTGARYSVPLGREAYTLTLFCEGYQPVILSRDFRDAPTRVVESVVLPVAPP